VFTPLVLAGTDKALRLFYALAEVVAATAAHAHTALILFPDCLRFVFSRSCRSFNPARRFDLLKLPRFFFCRLNALILALACGQSYRPFPWSLRPRFDIACFQVHQGPVSVEGTRFSDPAVATTHYASRLIYSVHSTLSTRVSPR
jgi:hypothetical protein